MFSRIPNLRICDSFFQNLIWFLLKQGRNFLLTSKKGFKKRHFAAALKENKIFFVKKIRGFIDSEFVKICHEHVR